MNGEVDSGDRAPNGFVSKIAPILVPILVFLFCGAVALTVTSVTPSFASMYKDLGQKLPVLTQLFLRWGVTVSVCLPGAYLVALVASVLVGSRAAIFRWSLVFTGLSGGVAMVGLVALYRPIIELIQNL